MLTTELTRVRTVSRLAVLVSSTHLGPKTRFLLLSDSRGFVDVELFLWREDGPDVYNCCWTSPAQSFWGRSPAGLMAAFIVSDSILPQPGGTGPRINIPQEQGGPVITPGTGSPFRRLLRLAGLRCRYWSPPPHGLWINLGFWSPDITSARTAQKAPLLRVPLLLRCLCRCDNQLHVMFTEPFCSIGRLCWFHNSGFEPSRH
jgi:hypothetical protein